MINNYLPDHLHAVSELLDDSCDVDRIDIPLVQLVKQLVHVWHDLLKHRKGNLSILLRLIKNTENRI